MAFTVATLDYFMNATGTQSGAGMTTEGAGLANLFSTSELAALSATFTSQAVTNVGSRVRVRVILGIGSAAFQAKFPSVEAGQPGPFANKKTSVVEAFFKQPVLAAAPAFT